MGNHIIASFTNRKEAHSISLSLFIIGLQILLFSFCKRILKDNGEKSKIHFLLMKSYFRQCTPLIVHSISSHLHTNTYTDFNETHKLSITSFYRTCIYINEKYVTEFKLNSSNRKNQHPKITLCTNEFFY